MKSQHNPEAVHVLLAGGGHSHAMFVKMFAMDPWPGVRVTLLSDDFITPYSGMLPALISGYYTQEDAFIHLSRLCEYAGIRFIRGSITGINPDSRTVSVAGRPDLRGDVLSVNLGSQPLSPDGRDFSYPVTGIKPVSAFLHSLERYFAGIRHSAAAGGNLLIIGGGVAGTEVALNLHQRLLQDFPEKSFSLTIVDHSRELLTGIPEAARKKLRRELKSAGIRILENVKVEGLKGQQLLISGQEPVPFDFCVLCTPAAPPPLLKNSGLALDERGFMLLSDTLESLSHPGVFGSGDCASIASQPRAKAGVFAVRQAAPLYKNVRRFLLGQKLRPLRLQKHFFKMIGTGAENAVIIRQHYLGSGHLSWKIKERIDRNFMKKLAPEQRPAPSLLHKIRSYFRNIPAPPGLRQLSEEQTSLCRGCAAKWDEGLLKTVFRQLAASGETKALWQVPPEDDGVLLNIPPGSVLVQSVDYLPAMTDDLWLFGRILSNHCLNDLYAMGASPLTAQLLLNLPFSSSRLAEEDAIQLMSGILYQFSLSGFCQLKGGHTSRTEQIAAGLVCNGILAGRDPWCKNGLLVGDHLVLTKAIGTGVLFAAAMKLFFRYDFPGCAFDSMLLPHEKAFRLALSASVHAATDISGFGLGGHLLQMADSSDCHILLKEESVPLIPGTRQALNSGYRSSLHEGNRSSAGSRGEGLPDFLWDPQTSGPLLFALSPEAAERLVQQLRKAGYPEASVIGEVRQKAPGEMPRIMVD